MKRIKSHKLDEIRIKEEFLCPSSEKMAERRELTNKELSLHIVINQEHWLVDGYTYYLVALERNLLTIDVWIDESTKKQCTNLPEMIMAKFPSNPKMYYWNVPKILIGKINCGDYCLVENGDSFSMMKVSCVIIGEENCPIRATKNVISVGETRCMCKENHRRKCTYVEQESRKN